MSFIDKLQFWKKEEPKLSSSQSNPFMDNRSSGFGENNLGMQDPSQSFGQNPFDQQSGQMQEFSAPQLGSSVVPQGFNNTQSSSQFSSPATQSSEGSESIHKRDVDLILSRLDLIKSEMENVQHRLTVIEQQMKKPRW